MNYGHPVLARARLFGQKLGVLRPLVRMYRRVRGSSYEERFDEEMMRLVQPGDVVWDVGANVGFFTTKFAAKVRPDGEVVAFEPAPATFETLRAACAGNANVRCLNVALSDVNGTATFSVSDKPNDPTNGLLNGVTRTGGVDVQVATATSLVQSGQLRCPSAIKIDVEGFEFEVVRGLAGMLGDRTLTRLFVEVHFQEQNRRGLTHGPGEIVRTLEGAGFEVRWVDPSHLIARRA